MPNDQFPLQPHVFGPGNGALSALIDQTSLQELSDERGNPIVAFTSKKKVNGAGNPLAVNTALFEQAERIGCRCITVRLSVPRGLRRVESLKEERPLPYAGEDAPELVVDEQSSVTTLALAAQLTEIEPYAPDQKILPDDLHKYHGISGSNVMKAALCGSKINPCRYPLKDVAGDYVAFELDWRQHYSDELVVCQESNFG